MRLLICRVLFLSGFFINFAYGEMPASDSLLQLQQHWAQANYQLEGKAQKEAFLQLIDQAEVAKASYPDDAGISIWNGIIKSTYAGVKGGIGALKYAKAAKKDLERAIEIDDKALSGSAYTSLGTLYFKVPGWPIAFGSDKKAKELLSQALQLNPDGIDSNYFYGEFLREQGDDEQATRYLQKALQAAPRQGREVADEGRRKDIAIALEKITGR